MSERLAITEPQPPPVPSASEEAAGVESCKPGELVSSESLSASEEVLPESEEVSLLPESSGGRGVGFSAKRISTIPPSVTGSDS